MKYKNLSFPEIPSKTQLFNKENTRMEYFTHLFETLLQNATNYQNLRENLMRLLYKLLIKEAHIIKLCTHERDHSNTIISKEHGSPDHDNRTDTM